MKKSFAWTTGILLLRLLSFTACTPALQHVPGIEPFAFQNSSGDFEATDFKIARPKAAINAGEEPVLGIYYHYTNRVERLLGEAIPFSAQMAWEDSNISIRQHVNPNTLNYLAPASVTIENDLSEERVKPDGTVPAVTAYILENTESPLTVSIPLSPDQICPDQKDQKEIELKLKQSRQQKSREPCLHTALGFSAA